MNRIKLLQLEVTIETIRDRYDKYSLLKIYELLVVLCLFLLCVFLLKFEVYFQLHELELKQIK